MGWFIAVFVTLMIAGSVLWIKPSKRDLRITELRREAMSQGIRVRLVDEKLKENLFPWLEDHRGYAVYENHQLPAREGRQMKAFEVRSQSQLHELDILKLDADEVKLRSLEKGLPEGVRGVVLFPDGVGLLWDESSGPDAVSGLSRSMEGLSEAFS
ncbi:hypothetical protein A3742_13305 [Oleiphilus sp. HI0071]|jgi:hypothetical protein|uniref:hypothetical protein n=1 Tax=unclassified Oleiphilus TaxID=2631174 RepID=UPI0007C3EF49|nr:MULTISPECIES: hypothetical protein [unclassified Oleiphilus]KZY62585.1 hypothetical protein A3737_14870 [Oleiphilus sp. HI0065]KZY80047.1 hypothetical protein A3742_13305 [Oleiphilus sp. HI0071]KZY96689.1 hypothetical protein A3744_13795 [Oleiphilus sp. HI0073]KZZ50801.1 hypothetical protein A3760_13225 [Oleiphilus sp. HI0122]KZZ74213.1 hypothetical protein A3767_04170 [Oleiphilus sp. HI0133]